LTSVGSTNFDNRSFRLNDEATLNIIDAAFAKEQTAVFNVDLQHACPMTLAEWLARPRGEKLHDGLASLIGAQLYSSINEEFIKNIRIPSEYHPTGWC
jgi:cardiolipin synthase